MDLLNQLYMYKIENGFHTLECGQFTPVSYSDLKLAIYNQAKQCSYQQKRVTEI